MSAELTNSSVNKTEDKVGHSLEEVAGMIRNTLSAFESKVNATSFICLLYVIKIEVIFALLTSLVVCGYFLKY